MDSRHLSALTAQKNSVQKFLCKRAVPLSIQRDFVFFFELEARMSEFLREIAVVRQDQQSFTLSIESANIEKPGKFWRQQVENRVARVRIAPGRNKSNRLVQRDRHFVLEMNELAVDFHMVALARLRAEICANASIDRDSSGRDQFVTFSPRANAGCGQEAI